MSTVVVLSGNKTDNMLSIVIVLIALAGFSYADGDSEWSHREENKWPGECGTGFEQSPIDINPQRTLLDPHGVQIRGDLVFRGYRDVRVRAQNTGYKVMWSVVDDVDPPVLSGGPLRGNYSFAEVHFHWLSEHSINGIKYPMEIHFVHTKTGLSMDEAVERSDGIAVIGVMAQVSSEPSDTLHDLLPAMSYILQRSEVKSITEFHIDLMRLMSPFPQAYFTYHGSLTTPTCAEAVTWIVMDLPLTVSHSQYKNITRADMDGINNDRGVQPLGSRLVYRTQYVSAACTHLLSPTLLGTLTAMLSCFSSKTAATLLSGLSRFLYRKKQILEQKTKN